MTLIHHWHCSCQLQLPIEGSDRVGNLGKNHDSNATN